jgi:hypothetical protein
MKIAGCSRDKDGVWRHHATQTYEGSLISSWDIAKEILDIAERALKLLKESEGMMVGPYSFQTERNAVLAEVADEKCPKCGNHPAPQPTIADRPCTCKPTVREKVEEMLGMEYSVDAALRTLADEIDRLKR